MTKRQLLERIEALERRVAELEARPVEPAVITIHPTPGESPFVPQVWPVYPTYPTWDYGSGTPAPIMPPQKVYCANADVQAQYDHDGLRSSGTV